MSSTNILNYIDKGEGKLTLVFLHYFGGSSGTWHKVIDELSKDFRCIAIDLPGFGKSREIPETLSVSECSEEVEKIIKALGLQQYILVGHSMGGKIAAYLTASAPEGLVAVVLAAPSPPVPEKMSDNDRQTLLDAYGNREALEKNLESITAKQMDMVDKENLLHDNMIASKTSWDWWLKFGSREDISAIIGTHSLPVLIISGEKDNNFSWSYLKKVMSPFYPLATFTEIPGAAHLIPQDAPVLLANAIRTFTESTMKL